VTAGSPTPREFAHGGAFPLELPFGFMGLHYARLWLGRRRADDQFAQFFARCQGESRKQEGCPTQL
jgi:hypothetical protein